MLSSEKVCTDEIRRKIPLYIRNILWYTLEMCGNVINGTHYFELSVSSGESGEFVQKLVHTRDIPLYQNKYQYADKTPVNASIVINVDVSGVQTMMFADEEE